MGEFMNKERVILSILFCMILNFIAFSAVPATPSLMSPLNGQTGMAKTPRFSWHKVTGTSIKYQIQISSNSGFNPILIDTSGLTDTNYNLTKSLNFSPYYWQVRAKNSSGNGNWSNPWTFTTEMLRQVMIGDGAFWPRGGGMNLDSINVELNYHHLLGYNYVLVYLNCDSLQRYMSKSGTHWVFDSTKYTDHNNPVVAKFLAVKNAVEAAGMHVLPAIEDLSHLNKWIIGNGTNWPRCDALSEFNSMASYKTFVNSNNMFRDTTRNAVSCANDTNKTARDIFVEQLKVIQKNWGNTTLGGLYPQYINIGHDEIGNWDTVQIKFVCYIGAEKTGSLRNAHGGVQNGVEVGKAWVLAKQIKTKKLEIDTFCNPGVKMIVWGDCFVPLDNGQSAGLTGDANGNGSVLQFLRDTMQLTKNLIIEPWNYEFANGDKNGLCYTINENTTAQFIQKFGFDYILATGEGGGCTAVTGSCFIEYGRSNVYKRLQVAYEAVRASQFYPNNLLGFGNNQYDGWTGERCDDTLAGYTAPILAYFGWTYGDLSLSIAKHQSFTPQVYAKFNPINSRKNLRWFEGTDYFRPSTDRILPPVIDAMKRN
jgi:hypothetical protein